MSALLCHVPWRPALQTNTNKNCYSQKHDLLVLWDVSSNSFSCSVKVQTTSSTSRPCHLSPVWTRMCPCLLSSIWHRTNEMCILRSPSFNCPLLITQVLISATQSDSAAFSGKGNYSLASVLFTARTRLLILLYLTKLLKTCKEKIDFQYGLFCFNRHT